MSFNNRPPQLPPAPERQRYEDVAEEASSRSLDFDPNVRARFIREMLISIPLWVNQGLSEDTIRDKVPEFANKYPELFLKIVKKEDLSPIHSMLAMLDRMGEGNLSQHQASIIIGKKLLDKYITPNLQ
jgi:hypothetical protein